jgi:hypothetical protein
VATVPSYLNLDRHSVWHTSALQAAALETALLPSRLKASIASRGLLSDIEQTFISISPQRKILQLEMSVKAHEPQINGSPNGLSGSSQSYDSELPEDHPEETQRHNPLDISLFPSPTSDEHSLRMHLFSNISVLRGIAESQNSTSTSAQARNPYSPIVQTYHTSLKLPLLSSYPAIFQTSTSTRSLPAQTSLSATSEVASWLRNFADNARILDRDQREEVSSELRTWADEYIEGWESGDEDNWDY